MTTHSLTSLSHAADLPFEYVGGEPALDLVNTVDWTAGGPENDRLTGYDRLTRWAEGARVISHGTGAALRAEAGRRPREAEAAYRLALKTRLVLKRVLDAVAQGKSDAVALEDFNWLLGRAVERMRVARAGGRRARPLELGWRDLGTSLESVIWPVIWSAASLLVSPDARRIRTCAGVDCGWMYVDRSRNRLRRWCQMATCGTREKSRRRYRRVRRRLRPGP